MAQHPFDPFAVTPGSKRFDYMNIEQSLMGQVDIPVGVIAGTSEGPTLAITAGLFAHEHCGIEAASRLYQSIQPEGLAGRVVIIPVVNMPCLQFRTPWFNLARSTSPLDGLNINTLFPGRPGVSRDDTVAIRQSSTAGGDPRDSVSNLIAFHLFHDVILNADYHVDLRGGDLDESHLTHTIYPVVGEEIDAVTESMARAFGFQYLLPGTPDIGHTSKGTLIYEATIRGIPSIISESGLGFRTQPLREFVMGHVNGVNNLMKHLHMIAGEPLIPQEQIVLDTTWHWIPVPMTGIFHAIADQGDLIESGQLLGTINDLDGSVLHQIHSPIDGIVHCMFPRRFVSPGDDVYTLLKFASQPAPLVPH
jgi:predicted deacylase